MKTNQLYQLPIASDGKVFELPFEVFVTWDCSHPLGLGTGYLASLSLQHYFSSPILRINCEVNVEISVQ